MEKKGLCITCASGRDCTFPGKLPVIQCEEFNNVGRKPKRSRETKAKK